MLYAISPLYIDTYTMSVHQFFWWRYCSKEWRYTPTISPLKKPKLIFFWQINRSGDGVGNRGSGVLKPNKSTLQVT